MIPVYFVCNYLLKVHQRLPSLYRPLAQELRHPLQCRDDFSSPFKRAKTSQCKYQQRKHGIQPRTHIISKWYHPRQEGGQQWIVVANQHSHHHYRQSNSTSQCKQRKCVTQPMKHTFTSKEPQGGHKLKIVVAR